MLILTFPEIHWAFGVLAHKSQRRIGQSTIRLRLCEIGPSRDALFNPTGLTQWVKRRSTAEMPYRKLGACSIDEEKSYAYLHAYTAYRFGFRVDVVTSWALMNELFGKAVESKKDHSSLSTSN